MPDLKMSSKITQKRVNLLLFFMFKEKFGHLNIPSHYTIPSNSTFWPSQYHKMNLGQYAQTVRTHMNSKVEGIETVDVRQLVEFGFSFVEPMYETTFVKSLFEIYRYINGNTEMTNDFIVPDDNYMWPEDSHGIPLGQILKDIMFSGQFASLHEDLLCMGYSLDSTNFGIDEELLSASLEAFCAEHKDKNVPLNFVVPHYWSRYPKKTWGYKLGEVVHCIKTFGVTSKYAELILNPSSSAVLTGLTRILANKTFSASNTALATGPMVLEAMGIYKSIYGISKVKKQFVVPIDDHRYPKEIRGIKLGEIMYDVRHNGHLAEHHDAFLSLGVDLLPNGRSFEVRFSALEALKKVNGHLNVSKTFVVPKDDANYPVNTWGFHLGAWICNLQSAKGRCVRFLTDAQCQQLTDLGLKLFDEQLSTRGGRTKKKWIQVPHQSANILAALEIYKSVHDSVDVPENFKISNTDNDYPARLRGMALGPILSRVISGEIMTHCKQKFEQLGVDFTSQQVLDYEDFYAALCVFKALHKHLQIPVEFVVPQGELDFETGQTVGDYPVQSHGAKLGRMLKQVLRSGEFSQHREELEELGLKYKESVKTYPFTIIYKALQAYKVIHGDLLVPHKFVVPRDVEEEYPTDTWGMNLGKIVMNIRHLNTFPLYRPDLEKLGFVFKEAEKQVEVD